MHLQYNEWRQPANERLKVVTSDIHSQDALHTNITCEAVLSIDYVVKYVYNIKRHCTFTMPVIC